MVCVSVLDRLLRSCVFVVDFHEVIGTAIPGIVECLKRWQWTVCRSAISGLSELRAHGLCQRP